MSLVNAKIDGIYGIAKARTLISKDPWMDLDGTEEKALSRLGSLTSLHKYHDKFWLIKLSYRSRTKCYNVQNILHFGDID